jgi:hypothetical protein
MTCSPAITRHTSQDELACRARIGGACLSCPLNRDGMIKRYAADPTSGSLRETGGVPVVSVSEGHACHAR